MGRSLLLAKSSYQETESIFRQRVSNCAFGFQYRVSAGDEVSVVFFPEMVSCVYCFKIRVRAR